MSGPVLLDITLLAGQPHRSGIQRVIREALRHWPQPDRLQPVVLLPSGAMLGLPGGEVRRILTPPPGAPEQSYAEDCAGFGRLVRDAQPIPAGLSRHVLNLELFYDPWRAEFYRRLVREGWRVQWLLYDFMPWLHPALFPQGISRSCMPFLHALREVPETAFISVQTASDYSSRIMRGTGRTGHVLPLGADGLGLERQSWNAARRDWVMLGTIEPRKNVAAVLEAARLAWDAGHAGRLVLAGRLDGSLRQMVAEFQAEAGHRLLLLDQPGDDTLRRVMRNARVVVSASTVEGFGLPPLEALAAGIPVISAALLPSLHGLPDHGRIALDQVTPDTLAAALATAADDSAVAALWDGASRHRLPGWQDFARALEAWTAGSVLPPATV